MSRNDPNDGFYDDNGLFHHDGFYYGSKSGANKCNYDDCSRVATVDKTMCMFHYIVRKTDDPNNKYKLQKEIVELKNTLDKSIDAVQSKGNPDKLEAMTAAWLQAVGRARSLKKLICCCEDNYAHCILCGRGSDPEEIASRPKTVREIWSRLTEEINQLKVEKSKLEKQLLPTTPPDLTPFLMSMITRDIYRQNLISPIPTVEHEIIGLFTDGKIRKLDHNNVWKLMETTIDDAVNKTTVKTP